MRFRVICAILLAMYLLVSGCQRESAKIPESEEPAESAETHETDSHETERTQETNTHETESTFVRSDQEIREIVEDALLRGEEVNLMYLGEFNYDNKAPSIEGFEAVNMEVQYNALSSQADVLELLTGIKSTDDHDVWHAGRFLHEWLDKKALQELKSTFSLYERADSLRGLMASIALFRRIAVETAEKLQLRYPEDTDHHITNWIRENTLTILPASHNACTTNGTSRCNPCARASSYRRNGGTPCS
ncbi:MAG: aminoglycoside 6-adenylyltransferase [Clostridiaceae bacterium]|nr:aminoglycoside 6-adenylyltransferase [Clostridiaceae bacterium]